MSAASERVRERIRKLLALANNNPSVEEAASAMGMALRLMRKYNLSEADVIRNDLRNRSGNVVREEVENGPKFVKNVADWYNILVTGVAQALSCHTVITRTSSGHLGLALMGYKNDVTVAKWLVLYIQEQVDRLADVMWQQESLKIRALRARAPYASERKRAKDQYRHGLVAMVLQRVRELYGAEEPESAAASNTERGLVVLKDQAIRDAFPAIPDTYEKIEVRASEHVVRGMKDAGKVRLNKVVETEQSVLPRLQ